MTKNIDKLTLGGAWAGWNATKFWNWLCDPYIPFKALVFSSFPAERGSKTGPLPRTFTKMSAILSQTPLVSCWHQRGAFGNPFSGRDFHPAHLGTSRHKLSVQGCLDIPSQWSWILKFTFRLWGKNSHRDGWPDLKQDPLPLMAPQLLNHTCCWFAKSWKS